MLSTARLVSVHKILVLMWSPLKQLWKFQKFLHTRWRVRDLPSSDWAAISTVAASRKLVEILSHRSPKSLRLVVVLCYDHTSQGTCSPARHARHGRSLTNRCSFVRPLFHQRLRTTRLTSQPRSSSASGSLPTSKANLANLKLSNCPPT